MTSRDPWRPARDPASLAVGAGMGRGITVLTETATVLRSRQRYSMYSARCSWRSQRQCGPTQTICRSGIEVCRLVTRGLLLGYRGLPVLPRSAASVTEVCRLVTRGLLLGYRGLPVLQRSATGLPRSATLVPGSSLLMWAVSHVGLPLG